MEGVKPAVGRNVPSLGHSRYGRNVLGIPRDQPLEERKHDIVFNLADAGLGVQVGGFIAIGNAILLRAVGDIDEGLAALAAAKEQQAKGQNTQRRRTHRAQLPGSTHHGT